MSTPTPAPAGPPPAVIVDVDGTVALRVDRGPYDETRVSSDRPNAPVVELVRLLDRAGYRVLFVSGRSEACRADTLDWLEARVGVPIEALHMRDVGDRRRDWVVKAEIYRRRIAADYRVAWVLDDRDQTVRGWRDLGLTCLQVAEGAF